MSRTGYTAMIQQGSGLHSHYDVQPVQHFRAGGRGAHRKGGGGGRKPNGPPPLAPRLPVRCDLQHMEHNDSKAAEIETENQRVLPRGSCARGRWRCVCAKPQVWPQQMLLQDPPNGSSAGCCCLSDETTVSDGFCRGHAQAHRWRTACSGRCRRRRRHGISRWRRLPRTRNPRPWTSRSPPAGGSMPSCSGSSWTWGTVSA